MGRTGRRRDGYVHVLLSEVREENNWDKARDAYGELQKIIIRGDQLELYDDVERLLPDHVKPELLEKRMEIEGYVREDSSHKNKLIDQDGRIIRSKKRRRDDNPDRNVPLGASKGFVSVADLLIKTARKSRKKSVAKEFDLQDGEDDSTDMELEDSLTTMRRAASASSGRRRSSPQPVARTGSARRRRRRRSSPTAPCRR